MSVPRWAEVFNRAYHDFDRRLEHNSPIPIDHYAIKSPAEFFAVFSEIFFERPQTIKDYYPNVFDQLVAFYRQNPLLTL
jgi:Mlc titration factor MtfA (ptsG expression regulator)